MSDIKSNKIILKGKFYAVNRHPGYVIFKNDKKNIPTYVFKNIRELVDLLKH